MMQAGTTVRVHYKGTLEDGSVFDSSEGGDPLEFEVGAGTIIPGFEAAVVAMQPGDTQSVKIPSGQAYGEVNEDLIAKVPRDQMPGEITPEVGMMLQVKTPEGEVPVNIVEVGEETVTLDGNHPLAGQDLTFELTLVSVG